jgi:hypothetical protein
LVIIDWIYLQQAVSASPFYRLIEYKHTNQVIFHWKENLAMFTKLAAVLIAVVLVFGSAAATASAAQESLPMDALYPIKTLSESIELGLTPGAQAKLEKALEHAQRRVDEMAILGEMGESIPQHLADGYAEQVEYTLRLASRMSEAEMTLALAKIQASLQEQLGLVERLQLARPADTKLAAVTTHLRQYMGLVALGLSEPQAFGESLATVTQGTDGPSSTQEPSVTETLAPGDDNSNDANANDSNSNDDDANGNDDSNSNDDNANGDDSNSNDDDANGNDDSNSNDDDANGNDDSNSNDDDANGNDNSNSNDDDANGNDDSNSNGGDDDGDDDSNSNGDDDDGDDDSNSNDDDDSGSLTSSPADSGSVVNSLYTFIAWIGSNFLFA